MDDRSRRHPGGHGIHRSLLEADFQYLGKSLLGAAGECAPYQTGTGAQERHSGLPVDRTTLAARAAERQLHSTTVPACLARLDAISNAVGERKGAHGESDSQSVG